MGYKHACSLALILGLAALGGCGDDDGMMGTDSGPGTDAGPGGDAEPTPDVPAVADSIVDVAVANGSFTTLVGALQRTGLDATLAGEGTFTVFAPPDSAFEGVDLDGLSDDALRQILLNHVITTAAVDSASIPATADNAADLTLVFDTSDGVSVNGAAVTMPDITASNGVIHVVDSIIMPATIADLAGYAGLSSLAGALTAADLLGAVADPEAQLTVFAPTNDAFTAAGDVPMDALANILLYHVISGAVVDSTAIPPSANTMATNEFDNNLTLLFNTESGVTINGGASVAIADVKGINGIVHVIDQVLLPMSVVDAAVAAGLTGLTDAVGAAAPLEDDTPVIDALGALSPITVFAPSNAAFEEVAAVIPTLEPAQITGVLLYHVVGGDAPVLSTDLSDGMVPTLLTDESLTIVADPPSINGNAVVAADINVTNGVVHVIDGVLIPPM